MKLAETVTFGGSGLDRAGELRGDPAALAAVLAAESTRAVVFWRGKPLVCGRAYGGADLVRLPMDHAVTREAREAPILLGREESGAVAAFDVSGWEPESLEGADLGAFVDQSEQHHPALPEDHVFAELRGLMSRISPRDAELCAMARAVQTWHSTHGFCARCGAKSEIVNGGWQRDCAACGAHHFPRTDPVVIMAVFRGNSVLLGRSPGWPKGMYSLLAGFIDPGESIEAAVRREVQEEAGVRVGPVSYLASQPWPFPASLMLGCKAEALSEEITIDPKELEDALWVTREELAAVFRAEHPVISAPRKGSIAHFIMSNWLADRLD